MHFEHKTKVLAWSEVKVTQSCLTFCDPMDYTRVHGILQARILEWVDFPFSRKSSQPRDQTQLSCIAGRFFTIWDTREALTQPVMSDSLWPLGLYSPWNSLGQNTGVGSLSLLPGTFQPRDWTQVSRVAGGFFTSLATREALGAKSRLLISIKWELVFWMMLFCD